MYVLLAVPCELGRLVRVRQEIGDSLGALVVVSGADKKAAPAVIQLKHHAVTRARDNRRTRPQRLGYTEPRTFPERFLRRHLRRAVQHVDRDILAPATKMISPLSPVPQRPSLCL